MLENRSVRIREVFSLTSHLFFPKFHQSAVCCSDGYKARDNDAHLETTFG